MQIKSDILKLLSEIGFIAAYNGFFEEAGIIFESLCKLRPEKVAPYISKACLAINKGEYENAVTTLRKAPYGDLNERDLRDVYLGKALKLAYFNDEARRILDGIVRNGTNPAARKLAKELLETQVW